MNHYAWRSENIHVQETINKSLIGKHKKNKQVICSRDANMSTLPLAVNPTILYRRSGLFI